MSKLFKAQLPVAFISGLFIFAAASFAVPHSAYALFSPIGVSVVPPIQMPPDDFSITGVRLDLIYGDNRAVYGFDLGVIGNGTDQQMTGIQFAGGFNYNKGQATIIGIQAAGITNINVNHTTIIGAQVALVNVNKAESSLGGFELGLVNDATYTTIVGAQVGLYNSARVVNGFQIGLINVADSLHGIQIGLANFNHTGLFSFAPILNVGF
jgi:hypothetical protein